MTFDVNEYVNAIEELLMKPERLGGDDFSLPQDVAEKMVKLLRLARIEVVAYETLREEQLRKGKVTILYEGSLVDRTRFISMRKTTGGNSVAVFSVFQRMGEREWTEQERNKIHVFLNTIFMVAGRAKTMRTVEFLTFHDKEFEGYNLTYFMKTAAIYISQSRIERFAVCYFNFRRLSVINQLVGYEQGTRIMKLFLRGAERLLLEEEFIFRIGGDNFGILFYKEKLEQIKNYLSRQDIVYDEKNGGMVTVSAFAGFYVISDKVKTPNEIMDKVSVAVNVARAGGRQQFVFYDEEIFRQVNEARLVETRFPETIKKEEFQVYYQPRVQLRQYKLTGAEALCRWNRDGQIVSPMEFIPVLEQSSCICTLDFFMLEHVCRDICRWQEEGNKVVPISVNFSRCHLANTNLVDHILQIIDKYQVSHDLIEIEFTETTPDMDLTNLKRMVLDLKKAGIRVSIDDFGVGYSSLNLLKEIPWDNIKIDREFLAKRDEISSNYIMLKHLVALAQELGMSCVAEGVETAEDVKLLKENNCFMAQGFYFDKPLPKEEFKKRLSEQTE